MRFLKESEDAEFYQNILEHSWNFMEILDPTLDFWHKRLDCLLFNIINSISNI